LERAVDYSDIADPKNVGAGKNSLKIKKVKYLRKTNLLIMDI